MRKLIPIFIIVLLLLVPSVLAQETVFDLPLLADGDVMEASFLDEITTHLYAFYGSEDDTVSITMEQQSDDLDPFLVLFDSEGAVLAYDDDSGALAFSAMIEDVSLDNDGVYFVMASSVYFVDAIETDTADELPYTLSVSGQTTPDNVADAETLVLDVEALEIGDSIESEITADSPIGLLYLAGNTGDSVTINLENADFLTLLMVFTPDGSRIVADASLAELDLEDDGIYILIATEQFFYEAIDEDNFFEGGSFTLVIE